MAIKKQKKKEMTLDRLALIMGKGFNEVHERIKGVHIELKGEVRELRGGMTEVKADVTMLKNGIEKFIMFYEKQDQEFMIMKDEMRRIKIILEEKLGVKI